MTTAPLAPGTGTPIEHIPGISLDKIITPLTYTPPTSIPPTRIPYYPLVGHRSGLKANDLVTLASAFWIYCNETGTLYQNADEASIY